MTSMALAGHVSRAMMQRYSHIRVEAKRRAVDILNGADFEPRVAPVWRVFRHTSPPERKGRGPLLVLVYPLLPAKTYTRVKSKAVPGITRFCVPDCRFPGQVDVNGVIGKLLWRRTECTLRDYTSD